MTPKTIYSAVAVAVALVLGLLAYTFLGGKGHSEIAAKCTTAMVASGKPQADAEKECKCSADILEAKLDSEQIELFMAGLNKNEESAKAIVTKKGPEWAVKTGQAIVAAGMEADKACKTK
jgi:hypothetical protein